MKVLTPEQVAARRFAILDVIKSVREIEQVPCRNLRFTIDTRNTNYRLWGERLHYFAYQAHRKLASKTRGGELVFSVCR